MKSILDYVSTRDFALWIAAHVLIAISIIVGAGVFDSRLLAALGCSAAALMAWPMYRTIIPVAYSVVVLGRWPRRG